MEAMEELAATVDRVSAAAALGLSRATYHRQRQTRPRQALRPEEVAGRTASPRG